jgi:hypothetical protein
MKKNKKLLLSFLALNTVFSAFAAEKPDNIIGKYDRMYNNIVRNIEKGNSNEKNYQIIEKVLKRKNKELKDLYLQNDYIVKPEFLEWQVFFSGFYEEHGKGIDNTSENAKYHSKVNGYYDANGNYVVTSGSINGMFGKPYRALQEAKEIDLGITLEVREPSRQPVSLGIAKPSLPMVTPLTPKSPTVGVVSPTLPPLVSFTVPTITAPATPALVTIPTPSFNTVVVSNFNPVNPVITMPATFTPPALDKISTGFSQGAAVGVNVENNILGNASASPVGGGTTVIKVRNADFDISGVGFNWNGYNDSIISASGTQNVGTVVSNYKHTFLNALAGSYTISGNWEFRNETTVASPNTTRFVSVNHAYGAKTLNTVFEIAAGSNVNLYGRADGHMTVGIEYQSYDALPAIAINNGVITLQSGKNLFGITAMIEKYAYTSTARRPLEESAIENRNRIIINSEDSIGIDFAQYSYSSGERPLTMYIGVGNIDINGQHNYGLRVPTVFDTQVNGPNYFNETLIDGSGGVITVAGTENVGVSLSKKITGSTLVAGVQGLTASNSSDIIGNIRNLNILVNGTKGVGILRNENFVVSTPGEIELNNTHIQSLAFGDNAQNSVLIRNDKYGVALNKNITIDNTNAVNTAIDNIVMLANDKNNLGGKQTYINNKAVITIGNNLKRATGLLAMNGGHALNSGTVVINGSNSQGMSVFGVSAGVAATGENGGTITVNGKESLGVYNAGTFNMSGGSIVSGAENSIGVYSDNTVNTVINGGKITSKNGGIALYSGDNSTIKLSGSNILKAEAGGLLFYNYINSSDVVTGKYDITGITTAQVDRGGMVLYASVNNISDITSVAAGIVGAFNNHSNLTVNMADGSNIMFIKSPGGNANITDFTGLPDLKTGFFNFVGTGYYDYVLSGFNLTLNDTTESNLDSKAYGKIQFLDTNVIVNPGVTVAGTKAEQVAIAQKNKIGGTLASRYITNNGIISLSGNKSTGIAGDYITMKNTATGEINIGTNSVGMYTANGAEAVNEGKITLGAGSVGMYGRNYFDGVTNSAVLGYGTDKINIRNEKNIETVSGGVTGNVTGIYADNILALANSTVNVTSTSNINLKGTGNVVGVFAGKTDINSSGTITAESATGGNAVGIYGENSTATSITGSINIKGGNGTGIYLKNSNISNGAVITVDNVDSGIGIYVEATSGNTSVGTNNQTINLGSSVTGMYALGASAADTGTVINSGTIQSLSTSSDKAIGMYIGANGAGNNAGNIYLRAVGTDKDQVGVYNDSGTFTMGSGNIEVYSANGAGLYAKTGTTNTLTGGIIKTGNGAIGLYADNGAVIQLSGTYKSVVDNGGIFALNNGTGSINIAGGHNIVVDVEAGGMAFSSSGSGLSSYLTSLVTGGGTLEINLKDPTSKLAILDSPGTILLSSLGAAYAPGATITLQVKISSSSNPNYTPFSITKGYLIVDQPVNMDNPSDSYKKSDFINSSVDVNSSISGTTSGQLGVGQINYGSGSSPADRARITINNNSIIDLSGNNSTGLLADFGDITNTAGSFIKVNGEGSVAVYAGNSSAVNNAGTINIGNKSVGIYGVNYLDGVTSSTALGYGNDRININNNGNIISTGTTHGGYGIYANNTVVPALNSIINLGSGSNIDVSSGEAGIGVYAVNSTLNIDGNITVGKDGVGVYASGTTGTINGGTISLNGDNAIGYYLTNGSSFTNLGGTIAVNGQNITLMITDASSSINLSTPFTVTSAPGSTYVVGNMVGGDFYNNTTGTLGSNGSLINGIGTVALFGTLSNINSTGMNVSGMVLSGQHAGIPGHLVSGSSITVNEEGTNLGIISLGDSSAGMYLTGGARGRNEGIITVNNNSVGIYGEGAGSLLSSITNNNGIINIGQESTGLFLKNGAAVSNTGTAEINSTSQKAVGMYSENSLAGTAVVMNTNKIDLSGDQSIGIYTTGENGVVNNGIIQIGNSLSPTQPGVGIYADHVNSYILNTGLVSAGDNSIGIYNQNGHVSNTGTITAGNSGTGIYSEGGTITLQTGSHITVGQNDAVGVYAVNQAGLVLNDSTVSVGDGSYGFVFTGTTTPSFINNQPATIGNNSIYVFADSTLNADNSGTLTMTGSDNIGYYLKNGGSFVNNADIIGSTGVSNIGVYAKGANIVNNADIILGNSNLIEHTDSNGKKYHTGYSVGIYGENSNITNSIGKTIQVGKDGIGIYVKGAGYTADNHGIINGVGDNSKGIFASDYAIVNNYGVINMTGDNVTGIIGQNGAQIYNHSGSTINVTGNDVAGIYLAGDDTKLVNNGTINIIGTGTGIIYTPTVETSNILDSTGATQGYTSKQYKPHDMPTLTNTGVININVGGNFNYDGIRVIVSIDPSTNTPTTNSSSQVGFGGVIPDKLEVAPDFATGTASDKYIFEDIFRGVTGKGEYISQSLTWDATVQGSDLVMTRKAYTELTDGLWYEDFGYELNEKYAVTYGEGRKIFDKINYITNEKDFRHIMASLAGNVYANINQREYDIARAFEDSMQLLQDSSNNTKENIKMSVIAGKGKNKEETDGVVGYDYTTTGVLALREVERTYRHTFGYSLGYVHTGFEFKDGNESEEWVDTIQLGLHNKYKANGWKLVNDLTGRASIHNVDRNIDWPSPNSRSEMDGSYETYSITSDNILGKEFEIGKKASIMPYGAFKAMYVTRPTFNEKGLEALEVEGNDAWSAKPRAGVELKGIMPLGANTAWKLKGTLDVAYEYELADLNEREKARLISIEDGYHKLSKPEDEKGIFRTRAAIGLEVEDRYGIFLTGEYSTGNDKEDDYRTGLVLKAIF